MGGFRSSIAGELQAFVANVLRFVRDALKQGGRDMRRRMIRERLSGPPGLNRKSGKLIRSLDYTTSGNDNFVKLQFSIGGHGAHYAEQHEQSGALGFRRLFAVVALEIVENIRIGFAFFARGGTGGDLSFTLSGVGDLDGSGMAALSQLQRVRRGESAFSTMARFAPKTNRGYQNLKPSKRLKAEALKSAKVTPTETNEAKLRHWSQSPAGGARESMIGQLTSHREAMKLRAQRVTLSNTIKKNRKVIEKLFGKKAA